MRRCTPFARYRYNTGASAYTYVRTHICTPHGVIMITHTHTHLHICEVLFSPKHENTSYMSDHRNPFGPRFHDTHSVLRHDGEINRYANLGNCGSDNASYPTSHRDYEDGLISNASQRATLKLLCIYKIIN